MSWVRIPLKALRKNVGPHIGVEIMLGHDPLTISRLLRLKVILESMTTLTEKTLEDAPNYSNNLEMLSSLGQDLNNLLDTMCPKKINQ